MSGEPVPPPEGAAFGGEPVSVFLVDAFPLIYQMFYGLGERKGDAQSYPARVVYSVVDLLTKLVDTTPKSDDAVVHVLFDGFSKDDLAVSAKKAASVDPRLDSIPRSHLASRRKFHDIRRHLLPSYKADRRKPGSVFYRAVDLLEYWVRSMPKRWVRTRVPLAEADDLLEVALEYWKSRGKTSFLLVSVDSDWDRALQFEGCVVSRYSPITREVVTSETFFKKWGYWPTSSSVPLYKAFRGDAVDGVPSAQTYLNEGTLLHIVNTYSSVKNLLTSLWSDSVLTEEEKKKIVEAAQELQRNEQVVLPHPPSRRLFLEYTFEGVDAPSTRRVIEDILASPVRSEGGKDFGLP